MNNTFTCVSDYRYICKYLCTDMLTVYHLFTYSHGVFLKGSALESGNYMNLYFNFK